MNSIFVFSKRLKKGRYSSTQPVYKYIKPKDLNVILKYDREKATYPHMWEPEDFSLRAFSWHDFK